MLKCENISVCNILDGISFDAVHGSFTAVIGKNGSGKTTLAKCIMGERKFGGSIVLDGVLLGSIPCRERAKRIAYLPQFLPSPNITVRELAALGRNPHVSLSSRLGDADVAVIDEAICKTGMQEFDGRLLPTLSGGEKQRAYLAMMLAQDADILLLDEPTAYMDMSAAAEFAKLIANLGKTVIVIMHDISLAAKYADALLILDGGKQLFFGSKEECINSDIIEKTFGVRRIEKDGEIVFLA